MRVFTADHKPWWVRPTVTPVYLPWEKDETSGHLDGGEFVSG